MAFPAKPHGTEALSAELRHAMRHVGSTVTIITTEQQIPFGMVATAMMSLSLEPPALAVGVNQSASICTPLLERGAFCVNVLSRYDESVSRRFTTLSGPARFSAGTWLRSDCGPFEGIPYLATAQSTLFCKVHHAVESGSHCLIVGAIERVINRAIEEPLLYCDGHYGRFSRSGLGAMDALDDRLALCS